jgi:hypothetical protein
VDVGGLRFSAEARTALAFVSLTAEGERSFVFYRHPSADMLMKPEDVNLDSIDGRKVFHFGSITMIREPSRSATLMAAQYAHSKGLLISYDPNLRLALWPDAESARMGMLTGLNYAHVVKISHEELEFLTGKQEVSALWRDGLQIIVVTRGAGGATVYTRREKFDNPGFPVETVDTTGAGDAFVGAFLVGSLEHWGQDAATSYLAHIRDICASPTLPGRWRRHSPGPSRRCPRAPLWKPFCNCRNSRLLFGEKLRNFTKYKARPGYNGGGMANHPTTETRTPRNWFVGMERSSEPLPKSLPVHGEGLQDRQRRVRSPSPNSGRGLGGGVEHPISP